MELNNELLMAYADGELSTEEASAVEKAIQHDEKAKAQLEVYLKSRKLLTEEYGHIKNEPAPEYLINTVLEYTKTSRRPAVSRVISSWPLQSIAASLIVGAFLGTGLFINIIHEDTIEYATRGNNKQMQALSVALSKELQDNFEKNAYTIVIGGESLSLYRRANFNNADGEYCMVFELNVTNMDAPQVKYITVCKDDENDWYITQ